VSDTGGKVVRPWAGVERRKKDSPQNEQYDFSFTRKFSKRLYLIRSKDVFLALEKIE
jgi:hypothetical protein